MSLMKTDYVQSTTSFMEVQVSFLLRWIVFSRIILLNPLLNSGEALWKSKVINTELYPTKLWIKIQPWSF